MAIQFRFPRFNWSPVLAAGLNLNDAIPALPCRGGPICLEPLIFPAVINISPKDPLKRLSLDPGFTITISRQLSALFMSANLKGLPIKVGLKTILRTLSKLSCFWQPEKEG